MPEVPDVTRTNIDCPICQQSFEADLPLNLSLASKNLALQLAKHCLYEHGDFEVAPDKTTWGEEVHELLILMQSTDWPNNFLSLYALHLIKGTSV